MVQPLPDKPAAPPSKPLPALVSELFDLIKTYATQEIKDPLTNLGRWVGWGVGGAVLIALGSFLLILGALRGVQRAFGTPNGGVAEWFSPSGSLTWVPYLAAVVIGAVVIGLCVSAIKKKKEQ